MGITTPDKAPPVNKPAQERIIDFSSGLNTTISGSLINKNEAQVAYDISFEQKGTILPRKGRVKRYETAFTPTPCTGMGALYKKDGTSRLLVTSDTRVYFDEPHLDTKWTLQSDWKKGSVEGKATVDEMPGDVSLAIGTTPTVTSVPAGVPFGTANKTYGYAFKSSKSMKAYKVGFRLAATGVKHTVTLWKVSDKSVVYTCDVTATKANEWEYSTFYTEPIIIEKDINYIIGVTCPQADSIISYDEPMTAASFITIGACTELEGTTMPDVGLNKKGFGILLGLEETEITATYDKADKWNLGTIEPGVTILPDGSLSLTKPVSDVKYLEDSYVELSTGTLAGLAVSDVGIMRLTSDKTWSSLGAGRLWSQL